MDDRKETEKFEVKDKGGTYKHQLIIDEMPKHKQVKPELFPRVKSGSSQIAFRDVRTIGSGQAHNNMPPYYVFNFCKQTETTGVK